MAPCLRLPKILLFCCPLVLDEMPWPSSWVHSRDSKITHTSLCEESGKPRQSRVRRIWQLAKKSTWRKVTRFGGKKRGPGEGAALRFWPLCVPLSKLPGLRKRHPPTELLSKDTVTQSVVKGAGF